MYIDYQQLGKRIRSARMEAGLSQALLAEFVDISPQYISHIETGRKKVSLDIIVRIATVLNLSLDQLITDIHYNNMHAYYELLSSLLSECSDQDRKIILDVVSALKKSLKDVRNNYI